ncbi:MAG: hypothetical protein FWD81_06605 [Methanomassiliicoccaceae archaeon]|nr:hypothetical protein [Methanomassiliicoccaceae archaeon]
MEDPERSLRKDHTIIRVVPYVIAVSALLALILAALSPRELGMILLRFCTPFAFGFGVLGVYAFVHRDESLLDRRKSVAALLLMPLIASAVLIFFTTYIMPDLLDFLNRFMFTDADPAVTVFISVYLFTLMMMFTSHGVISTVVAYFRRYTAKIYLSIENIGKSGADTRRNRISRWVYDIPDIIDIERIEMDPPSDDEDFPMRTFTTLALSIFLLGLAVSSYIFLNPIFERTLSLEEAILVTVILTFFIPVLVMPWLITRDTGAKIKSQARDHYLWKGMKRRLYAGAFAFMMFFSLFAISVYMGYDIVRASYTYAGYVAITGYLSLLFAFIYSNYYHKGFKDGIIRNFNESKK